MANSKYYRYLGLSTCLFIVEFLVGRDIQANDKEGTNMNRMYIVSN